MNLSDYIKQTLENTKSQEVVFDLRLNNLGEVDDNGLHKIKFKLVRKKNEKHI